MPSAVGEPSQGTPDPHASDALDTRPAFFFDTSALAKRYISEAGTQQVLDLFRQNQGAIWIAQLTLLEIKSLLRLATDTERLTGVQARQIWLAFEGNTKSSLNLRKHTEYDWEIALELIGRSGLRPADSLQLACAMALAEELAPRPLVLVCCDERLSRAAKGEGLSTTDPTQSE